MNLNRKALLVIDMLNDFVLEGAVLEVPAARKIIPNIKEKLEEAKEKKIPIIYICDSHTEDDKEFEIWPPHAIKGTKGAQVVEELSPKDGDYLVEKTTYSGFYNTKLSDILKKLNINELIVTGTMTNICVMYTASDAVLRGYKVIVPENCVAGLNEEDHQFALKQMKNVLKAEII
jgi:nicotinamidase-related amidase